MRLLLILLLLVAFSSFVSSKNLTAEEDIERARICGKRPEWFNAKNVTGSGRALPEQAPWTVLLKFRSEWNGKNFTCTGSWISTRHIATVTTCAANVMITAPMRKCKNKDAVFTHNFTDIEIFTPDGSLLNITPSIIYAMGMCSKKRISGNDLAIIELSEDVEFTETGSIWPICITGDRSLEKPGARFHTFYLNPRHVNSFTEALNYRSYKILLVPEPETQSMFNVTSEDGSITPSTETGGSSVVLDDGRLKLLAVSSQFFAPNTHSSVGHYTDKICAKTGICLTSFF